ncbi:MAG: 50S ribosomal protein L35 [Candidatus Omnitrophota bacterium]
MPKLKTNKSAAKRFKITKSGKIKKRSANRGHILGKMSRKRKRKLRHSSYLDKVEVKKIRRLLPYGSN